MPDRAPPGRPRWAASAMLAPPLLGCPATSPRARSAGQLPLGLETRAVAAGVVGVAGGRPHRLLLGRCAAQPAPIVGSRRGLTERDLGHGGSNATTVVGSADIGYVGYTSVTKSCVTKCCGGGTRQGSSASWWEQYTVLLLLISFPHSNALAVATTATMAAQGNVGNIGVQ
jgi:hypothetical protein